MPRTTTRPATRRARPSSPRSRPPLDRRSARTKSLPRTWSRPPACAWAELRAGGARLKSARPLNVCGTSGGPEYADGAGRSDAVEAGVDHARRLVDLRRDGAQLAFRHAADVHLDVHGRVGGALGDDPPRQYVQILKALEHPGQGARISVRE